MVILSKNHHVTGVDPGVASLDSHHDHDPQTVVGCYGDHPDGLGNHASHCHHNRVNQQGIAGYCCGGLQGLVMHHRIACALVVVVQAHHQTEACPHHLRIVVHHGPVHVGGRL